MDRAAVEAALQGAGVAGGGSATHIFHCAYIMKDEPAEESEVGVGLPGAPAWGAACDDLRGQQRRMLGGQTATSQLASAMVCRQPR